MEDAQHELYQWGSARDMYLHSQHNGATYLLH